jgi:predicted TIM-barrel fold metal-dependent hydrolase
MKQMARSKDTHYKSALEHPFSRLCFGTDVPIEEMEQVVDEYRSIMDALKLEPEVREKMMGRNVEQMFKLQ